MKADSRQQGFTNHFQAGCPAFSDSPTQWGYFRLAPNVAVVQHTAMSDTPRTNCLPRYRPRNIIRRAGRAADLSNTCPASRHVLLMAERLMTKGGYPMLAEEPDHCAGSLASVVESLWKARKKLRKHGIERKP